MSCPHDTAKHLHEITILIYRSYNDNPTAKMLNASPEMGNDRKGNPYVINAFDRTPSPEALKNHVLPNKHNVNSSLSVDMRERSESFVVKARQRMILGNAIASETAFTELVVNQNQLISELQSRNKSKAGPDSEKEVGAVVQAVRSNLVDPNDRIRRSTMETQRNPNITSKERPQVTPRPIALVGKFIPEPDEPDEHADSIYANDCAAKSNDFRNKNTAKNDYSNNDYTAENNDYPANNHDYSTNRNDYSGSHNNYAANHNDYAANHHDYAANHNDYADNHCDYAAEDNDNIYVNFNSKISQDVVDMKSATKNDYVTMNGNNGNNQFHRSATFAGTCIKPDMFAKTLPNNEDDCENSEGNPEDYVAMGPVGKDRQERSFSVQLNKTDLVHLRGDFGCIYESNDYSYIYEINPRAFRGNGHPFTKTKQKAKPQPCYCHEDPDREAKIQRKLNARTRPIGGSQNVYYSCEDIYVSMKNKEGIYSSLNDLGYDSHKIVEDDKKTTWTDYSAENDAKLYKFDGSDFNQSNQEKSSTLDAKSASILKKKLIHIKQLFADW